MAKRILLGMLTPSSNTVLEPVTSAILAGLPDVTAHFGRFRVTEISLRDDALEQFDMEPLLAAARLLADAKVDVMCWNGTSAGWLGFASDEALCERITETTGVPACTSVLALNEVLQLTGARRLGLVTPYLNGVQQGIVENYGRIGVACVAEQHLDISENFAFSEVAEDQISNMIRAVAKAGPDAITTFCTNLMGAPLVANLERQVDVPIYDTVSTAVWKSLRMAGVDPAQVTGWGRLFSLS